MGAGAFFLPIAREFDTTRASISWAFSAIRLEGGLTGPLEGFLIDRFGPRRMMLVGWVIFGFGFLFLSVVQSLPQFFAAFLIAAFGSSLAGFLPISTTVVNWFSRWRGTALGIVLAGNSLGGLFVPLMVLAILTFGWRPTAAGMGVFVILTGIPLSLVMRRRPEDYGMLPDGDQPEPESRDNGDDSSDVSSSSSETQEQDLSVRQALRTSPFWFLAFAHSGALTAWSAVAVHLIPALVDTGMSETQAGAIFAVQSIVASASRLGGGFLGDKIGIKQVLVAAYICQALALIILAFASTPFHAVLFAIFMGMGFGARGPLTTALRGNLFGRKNYATISGAMEPLTMLGSVIAPVLAGVTYDIQHSYTVAFLAIAVVNIVSIALLIPIRKPVIAPENVVSPHSAAK